MSEMPDIETPLEDAIDTDDIRSGTAVPAAVAADGDRVEQAQAAMAVADGAPTPLPDRALDTANPADVAEQAQSVPPDERDEYP